MTAADRAQTIYIAEPMRWHVAHEPVAFHEAEDRLRAAGWGTVHNPVVVGAIAFGLCANPHAADVFRRELHVLGLSGAVALLPGWERSAETRVLVTVAFCLGLDFVDAVTCVHMSARERNRLAIGVLSDEAVAA
jgi:hypothetical protein